MVENLLISLKKSTEDAIKTASKKAIQKTAEAIGNKIADKITSDVERTTYKKRYMSPEERQQIIDKLRLVSIKI